MAFLVAGAAAVEVSSPHRLRFLRAGGGLEVLDLEAALSLLDVGAEQLVHHAAAEGCPASAGGEAATHGLRSKT
mgnify:CR=1 FL=1